MQWNKKKKTNHHHHHPKTSVRVIFLARTYNAWIPQGLKPSEQFLDQRSKHGLASVQVTQNLALVLLCALCDGLRHYYSVSAIPVFFFSSEYSK